MTGQPPDPPPRYDEVFAEGMRELDSLEDSCPAPTALSISRAQAVERQAQQLGLGLAFQQDAEGGMSAWLDATCPDADTGCHRGASINLRDDGRCFAVLDLRATDAPVEIVRFDPDNAGAMLEAVARFLHRDLPTDTGLLHDRIGRDPPGARPAKSVRAAPDCACCNEARPHYEYHSPNLTAGLVRAKLGEGKELRAGFEQRIEPMKRPPGDRCE